MTMAFIVMGFGTLLSGLALRRDPQSGLTPPILKALSILSVSAVLLALTTVWAPLQRMLMTQPLTGEQWLGALGLAVIVMLVIETEKWVRRRGLPVDDTPTSPEAVLTGTNKPVEVSV
jgi:Ca2+-transporting ATPase